MALEKVKMHSGLMEVYVANLIDWRKNVIVPNVYYGLGLFHECDLLVLDQSGYLTEIEIKISKADLKKDFEKGHNHRSSIISRLVYAVPENLLDYAKEIVPKNYGLIVVKRKEHGFVAEWVRFNKKDRSKKPSQDQIKKLHELGVMRIWTLKRVLHVDRQLNKRNPDLKEYHLSKEISGTISEKLKEVNKKLMEIKKLQSQVSPIDSYFFKILDKDVSELKKTVNLIKSGLDKN